MSTDAVPGRPTGAVTGSATGEVIVGGVVSGVTTNEAEAFTVIEPDVPLIIKASVHVAIHPKVLSIWIFIVTKVPVSDGTKSFGVNVTDESGGVVKTPKSGVTDKCTGSVNPFTAVTTMLKYVLLSSAVTDPAVTAAEALFKSMVNAPGFWTIRVSIAV